jgi:hypothetical protein
MPREPQGLSRRPLPDADKRAASLARQLALLFIGEARRGIPLGHIETFLLVAGRRGPQRQRLRGACERQQERHVAPNTGHRGRHAHARAWARLGDRTHQPVGAARARGRADPERPHPRGACARVVGPVGVQQGEGVMRGMWKEAWLLFWIFMVAGSTA